MPIVSIVIPTRNRQIYAVPLIQMALAENIDCQVVVSDNSDDDSLKTLLGNTINDSRLIYRYTPGLLSMVDNFNLALDLADGDFVTFLGDDDMIGPGFFDIVYWAKKERIDAITCKTKGRFIHYFWPGVSSKRWGDIGGKLFCSDFSGKIEKLNLEAALRDATLHLGSGPRCMPRIYLGLISKSLLNNVRASYGSLFGGVSPDIYSSHLFASVCRNSVVIDYPFIIPGASPKSPSAARAKRTDVGSLTANDHISRFTNIQWDSRVPRYYSPYTVWGQSHVEALLMTDSLIPLRSFAYLYATCLVFTPRQFMHVWVAIKAHLDIVKAGCLAIMTLIMILPILVGFILSKIPAVVRGRPSGAKYVICDIPETKSALVKFTSLLAMRKIHLLLDTFKKV